MTHNIQRLPCRGCMNDCKNYQYCEGKLWRTAATPQEAQINNTQTSKSTRATLVGA